MVSSGTVHADAVRINNNFTTYLNSIQNTQNSWKGASKDNAVKKVEEFITEYKPAISNQMSSFATALDLYQEYLQWKAKYEAALAAGDEAAAAEAKQKMDELKPIIESTLASVTAGKLASVASIVKSLDDFVNYYQYNYSESYGYGTTIASAGCGPTSAAMVLSYMTDDEVTPVEAANWSLDHGYRVEGNGTAWTYFEALADEYGVECEQMEVSKDNIISNLEEGKQIIMSMAPGHFTKAGHFIVLKGLDENGKVIVADPNSESRSNQTWDTSVFLSEGKQQWVFS